MMQLRDVRDFIATLGIAHDKKCYCGRMPDKEDESIGSYPLKNGRERTVVLGGEANRSYGTKGISILVHWNKNPTETEVAAMRLYKELAECKNVTINGHKIKFVRLPYDEPIPIGTDEKGVFEYVVECLFYYDKE